MGYLNGYTAVESDDIGVGVCHVDYHKQKSGNGKQVEKSVVGPQLQARGHDFEHVGKSEYGAGGCRDDDADGIYGVECVAIFSQEMVRSGSVSCWKSIHPNA